MKPKKDYVKIKLRRNTTMKKYDMYGFKMALFDHVQIEEFISFE